MKQVKYRRFLLAYFLCPFIYSTVLGLLSVGVTTESFHLLYVFSFFIPLAGSILFSVHIVFLSLLAFYLYKRIGFYKLLVLMNVTTYFSLSIFFLIPLIEDGLDYWYRYSLVIGGPSMLIQTIMLLILIPRK